MKSTLEVIAEKSTKIPDLYPEFLLLNRTQISLTALSYKIKKNNVYSV